MGWTVARTGRVLRPMNGVDLDRCMDAANSVDPRRGRKWFRKFQSRAAQLGYVESGAIKCRCCSEPCRPECGLGRLS